MLRPARLLLVALALSLAACEPAATGPAEAFTRALVAPLLETDFEGASCRARVAAARQAPAVAGTPVLDARRAMVLGRALGQPLLFTRAPVSEVVSGTKPRGPIEMHGLVRRHRHDKAALRAQVLREGYLYSEDPLEAYALVRELTLDDLFSEPTIFLQRGRTLHTLEREYARLERRHRYLHADGPEKGREGKLYLFDRVGIDRQAVVSSPLHRDLRALRDRAGFDRMRVEHHGEHALVATLRFGSRWVGALIEARGPELELACLDAESSVRSEVEAFVAGDAARRRAVASLQRTIGLMVEEKMPFDRPRDAPDHLSDGQLRPHWEWAYRRGHGGFARDEKGYGLFDAAGRPHPPQTCVELVLDTFERASGTWYRPAGEPREKIIGALDFSELGIGNRSGVLAFEKFAESKPELYETRRFDERVPFADREAFFEHLVAKADWFQPGDVVAIQGPKPDGYVHQHAILIEDIDPLTGMPHALFDQMKHPRRRSWEMIMGEAPRRALLYHLHPKPSLLLRLDPEHPRAGTRVARAERSPSDAAIP
jgi:hypothetical protein